MKRYETLTIEKDEATAVVSLNRPPMNLFNTTMIQEIIDLAHSLREEREIRFVILTAQGNHFSGGADLKEIRAFLDSGEYEPEAGRYHQLWGHEVMRSLENVEQVTVAALRGAVVGAGMAVAMACDFRIMAEDSFYVIPESMVGVYFTWGCTPRLVRMVGASKAMELVMTCDPLPAQEAYRIGLANRVVPPERVLEAAREFVAKIASRSPTAVRFTKKIALAASMQGFGNLFVCEPELMQSLLYTGETEEGIRAFLEKRPPRYEKKRKKGG
jgi:enoyl-CoA hydratase/carnithine racemase